MNGSDREDFNDCVVALYVTAPDCGKGRGVAAGEGGQIRRLHARLTLVRL